MGLGLSNTLEPCSWEGPSGAQEADSSRVARAGVRAAVVWGRGEVLTCACIPGPHPAPRQVHGNLSQQTSPFTHGREERGIFKTSSVARSAWRGVGEGGGGGGVRRGRQASGAVDNVTGLPAYFSFERGTEDTFASPLAISGNP